MDLTCLGVVGSSRDSSMLVGVTLPEREEAGLSGASLGGGRSRRSSETSP